MKEPRTKINLTLQATLLSAADNKYLVTSVGDNRENSNDSRVWGPIPYRHVVGKMVRRLNKRTVVKQIKAISLKVLRSPSRCVNEKCIVNGTWRISLNDSIHRLYN